MFKYHYSVPEEKQIRLIVHTDCKNEADDQFALAQAVMTPKFDVVGIVAGHFDAAGSKFRYNGHVTARASYDEVEKVLELMHVRNGYKVYLGAETALEDENTPIASDGARFIVEEAMMDDPRQLFIAMQGAITFLASAILMEPAICSRMTALWVGGGEYPDGGSEFNLSMDVAGANVVFGSAMPLWQLPKNVYKQMAVSLAELEYKVRPCGKIGEYLCDQMNELNLQLAKSPVWPHGEIWGLGDNSAIAALMAEYEKEDDYQMLEAPRVEKESLRYIHSTGYRPIRVYHHVNDRLTLEDLFCKLRLNFPERDS